jgi:hypothetical protein
VLALGLGLAVSSCRAVVAGDGRDAAADLCAFLQRCYGNSAVECNVVHDRLDHGDADVDDQFLAFMSQNQCLSTCNDAKKCWDYPPICGAVGAVCEKAAECCGATLGHQICDASRCCTPVGVPCDDTTRCCGGVECKRVEGTDIRTCSGVPACAEEGQSCVNNNDCCSKRCDGGVCRQKTCASVGETCGDGKTGPTCCPSDAPGTTVDCVAGVCQLSSCHPSTCGDPVPCDPNGDPAKVCCGDPTLRCVTNVAGTYSICVSTEGTTELPDGFDCAYASDCCGGACALAGAHFVCTSDTLGCVGADQACVVDPVLGTSDCCVGDCVGGKCVCGGTTCHSSYVEGPPIACAAGDPGASPGCDAQKVCAADAFCCCNLWDSVCVSEAFTICGPPTL